MSGPALADMSRPGIANWHWRSMNMSAWARQWFEDRLKGTDLGGAGFTCVELKLLEGDCELSQRKSKVITIYDFVMKMDVQVGKEDKVEVCVSELSHEVLDGLASYEWKWGALKNKKGREQAQKALEELFEDFQKHLLEQGTKMQVVWEGKPVEGQKGSTVHAGGAETSQRANNGVSQQGAQGADKQSVTHASKTKSTPSSSNTSTISISQDLQCSREDLYRLLTDQKSIEAWSRSSCRFVAETDKEFFLFSGGVQGRVQHLKPELITLQWKLKDWTAHGTLEMHLDQRETSTNLKLILKGVPKGDEAEMESNLNFYYFQNLKAFGLGSML